MRLVSEPVSGSARRSAEQLLFASIRNQLSFESTFAPQPVTEQYVNWGIDEYGIREHIQFNCEVVAAHWDAARSQWRIRVRHRDGQETIQLARAIISAVGFFDRPALPDIPGLQKFTGLKLHTIQTNDEFPTFAGKRVAVIGNGPSGMQMMPIIAPKVDTLTVFQRTPAWVLPVEGYRDPLPRSTVWLKQNMPFYSNWTRFTGMWMVGGKGYYDLFTVDPLWKHPITTNPTNMAAYEKMMAYLQEKLGDRPDLLAQCTPNYPPFSKRFVVDNGWFDMLHRENVNLVTSGISHITDNAIVDTDGVAHEADIIIFATGFRTNDFLWPMEIVGIDGATPQQLWEKDGGRAYLGITMPRIPNFFCLYGPNTNPRVAHPISWGEMQSRYALECLRAMVENGWSSLEVREQAFDRYNAALDAGLARTNFLDPRSRGYYQNEFGRSAAMAPWSSFEYWVLTKRPHLGDYDGSEARADSQ